MDQKKFEKILHSLYPNLEVTHYQLWDRFTVNENGEFVKAKGLNPIWSPLFSTLVSNYNYRGGIKSNHSLKEDSFSELYKYDQLLKEYATDMIENKRSSFIKT